MTSFDYDQGKLTPAEQAEYKFLSNQEHQAQRKAFETGFYHPNVNQDWDRARKELKDFVAKLQKKGRNVFGASP